MDPLLRVMSVSTMLIGSVLEMFKLSSVSTHYGMPLSFPFYHD